MILVVMSANNTVKKATSGRIYGVDYLDRGGRICPDSNWRFTVLHYSGEGPTVGFVGLMADSNADAVKEKGGREGAGDRGRHCCKNVGILFLRKQGGIFTMEFQLSKHFYFRRIFY